MLIELLIDEVEVVGRLRRLPLVNDEIVEEWGEREEADTSIFGMFRRGGGPRTAEEEEEAEVPAPPLLLVWIMQS